VAVPGVPLGSTVLSIILFCLPRMQHMGVKENEREAKYVLINIEFHTLLFSRAEDFQTKSSPLSA
jgi:hypothetical protein